jgi:oligopeptide transport system substrate-binding protein
MGPIKTAADGSIVPALAERWDISSDGKVYTFYLRRNAKWSDGSPLTAADYVYSYRRVVDPNFASENASVMFPILNAEDIFGGLKPLDSLGVAAVDDYTLRFSLENPTPYFLETMLAMCFSPVKESAVRTGNDWHRKADTYICNGPFMVKSFEFGKQIVLVKNPYYYDTANVKLEEITFRVIGDMGTGLTAVTTGEIDGYDAVPSAEVANQRTNNPAFNSITMLSTTYYLVNKQKAPYNDPRVARALALAIDREAIIKDVLQNVYAPGYALVPPGMVVDGVDFRKAGGDYGFTPNAQVDEAQRLLSEAGFPGGRGFPVMRLRYYTNDNVKKVVEALQQMWKKNLNIDVEISNADWQVYFEEVKNLDYDIAAMGGTADVPHPAGYIGDFITGNMGSQMTGFRDPVFDDLIKKANTASSSAECIRYLHEAEDYYMSQMPTFSVYHSTKNFLMRTYVKGFYCTSTNTMSFENAYIEGRGR